jgi:hypothetical protein
MDKKETTLKHSTEGWFHSGSGPGRGEEAPKHEVFTGESEEGDMFEGQSGAEANDYGGKPLFAAGEMPLHHGSGQGRGHGPDDSKIIPG